MRKLILKMSTSLDGFVGGPNGEIDWLLKTMDDAAAEWTINAIWQAGLHIMGRCTFNDMAAYWPYANDAFAPPMNEIPKMVFTRKGPGTTGDEAQTTGALKDATALNRVKDRAPNDKEESWIHATVATGDLAEEINALKQQPGKDIIAHGGASFAQSLIKTGLIDEYKLLVHPVAVGKGLPLFSELNKPQFLRLVSSTLFRGGTVAQVYRPVKEA